jgi:hypothetical protein
MPDPVEPRLRFQNPEAFQRLDRAISAFVDSFQPDMRDPIKRIDGKKDVNIHIVSLVRVPLAMQALANANGTLAFLCSMFANVAARFRRLALRQLGGSRGRSKGIDLGPNHPRNKA